MTFTLLDGGTGDIRGGAQVVLKGSVLDMSSCTKEWSTLTGWTSFGATVAPGTSLSISASGFAGVRSDAPVGDVDAETTFTLLDATLPLFGRVIYGQLGLYVGPSYFRVGIEYDSGLTAIFFDAVDEAASVLSVRKYIRPEVGKFIVRIQRLGARVYATCAGETVSASWRADAASIEVAALDSETLVGTLVRQPVISFGDRLTTGILAQTGDRLVAVAPPADVPGIVSISAVGCATSDTLVDAFEYTAEERFQIRARTAVGRILNDDVLRNTDGD